VSLGSAIATSVVWVTGRRASLIGWAREPVTHVRAMLSSDRFQRTLNVGIVTPPQRDDEFIVGPWLGFGYFQIGAFVDDGRGLRSVGRGWSDGFTASRSAIFRFRSRFA
jgi:hypothetical protein